MPDTSMPADMEATAAATLDYGDNNHLSVRPPSTLHYCYHTILCLNGEIFLSILPYISQY